MGNYYYSCFQKLLQHTFLKGRLTLNTNIFQILNLFHINIYICFSQLLLFMLPDIVVTYISKKLTNFEYKHISNLKFVMYIFLSVNYYYLCFQKMLQHTFLKSRLTFN